MTTTTQKLTFAEYLTYDNATDNSKSPPILIRVVLDLIPPAPRGVMPGSNLVSTDKLGIVLKYNALRPRYLIAEDLTFAPELLEQL